MSERLALRRSRTGCWTCKQRRIRCDEERPACKRCTSTGRHCDGYPDPLTIKKSKPQPMVMMIVTEFEHASDDAWTSMHLQYFFRVSAPALKNHRTTLFWNTTVLQACQQISCVRHLAVAVALLERLRRDQVNPAIAPGETEVYMHHYSQALKQMSTSHDLGVVLIGCLMLVLLEDLRRNPYGAIIHVRAGHQLLNDKSNHLSDRSLFMDLQAVFSALFAHQPELAANAARISSVYKQNAQSRPISHPSGQTTNMSLTGFAGLEHASDMLELLRKRCVSPRPCRQPLHRFHIIPGLTEELNQWLEDFNIFISCLTYQQQETHKGDIHALRGYHLILQIAACCMMQEKETWYDFHDQHFEGLVKKFAILCNAGHANLAPLIFFVACKYRDIAGRRRAIELLRYQVNGWEGEFLANVAEKIVQVEENGLDQPVTSADIPEYYRVRLIAVTPAHRSLGRVALCLRRAPFTANAQTLEVTLPAPVGGVDFALLNSVLRSATDLVYTIRPKSPLA